MNVPNLVLPVSVFLAVGLGCSRPGLDPKTAIQVQVSATPGTGSLFLDGKALGPTPQTLKVDSLDALLQLTATSGKEEVVEKRVRFLALNRAEVVFVFGAGHSPTAKALGLARILVFDYGAAVTFELDRADLKPDFLPLLDRQADLLKRHFAGLDVFVCGHTDTLGTQEHNLALSLGRAKAVAGILGAAGVPRERMKVEGFGSAYPVAPNQTEPGRAQNRRTELVLPQ